MSFNINANAKWVGKIDWELKKFHGEEYSTHKGSTYNSYLIRDEKAVGMSTLSRTVFIRSAVEIERVISN